LLGEREVFAVLRFFYLVRIAQQGYLHLIANAYPTLESEAIIYLADKLVAGSMGGISTIRHDLSVSEMVRDEARNIARDIAFKLYREANEPVGDGFKTTYKDIMEIAHSIAGQGMYEYQKNGNTSNATFLPSIAPVPPVYIVIPQMSMVGGDVNSSVPNIDPTLPIPGFLLSSATTLTQPVPKDPKEDAANSAWTAPNAIVDDVNTVPAETNSVELPAAAPTSDDVSDQTPAEANGHADAPNATDQEEADTVTEADPVTEADEAATSTKDTEKTPRKKKSSSNRKKSKKSQSNKSKRRDSKADDDTTTQGEQPQSQAQEPDNTAKPVENNVPQQQEEEQEESDNEEDRFADADLSDDEHEIIRQDDDHDDQVTDTTSRTRVQEKTTTSTPRSDTTTTAIPSPTQWQNFAATCHNDTDGSNTPLSPKSSTRSSPKIERK